MPRHDDRAGVVWKLRCWSVLSRREGETTTAVDPLFPSNDLLLTLFPMSLQNLISILPHDADLWISYPQTARAKTIPLALSASHTNLKPRDTFFLALSDLTIKTLTFSAQTRSAALRF